MSVPTPVARHVRVSRTARFYQLGEHGPRVRELWIACHGYAQLAEPFALALEPLNDGTRVIVAPEGLSRFYLDDLLKRHGPDSPVGASWMTFQDRESEIGDYVEYLDAVARLAREEAGATELRVVALGFSQGVATVSRWAAMGNTRVDRLILWAGSLPPDLPKERGNQVFRGARITIVAGRKDTLITQKVLETQQRALAERGLESELVMFDGGHSLSTETLRRIGAQ